MLCPKCFSTVDDNFNNCPNCGTTLKSTQTNNNATTIVGGIDMSLTSKEQQQTVNTNVGGIDISLTGSELTTKQQQSTMMGGIDMSLTSGTPEVKEKKDYITPIKNFIIKNKKLVIILLSLVLIVAVGLILFYTLWDFTKINWDKKYGNYATTYTGPTTVELKVNAYDREENKIYDIEYKVDGGEIKVSGTKVKWTLPEKAGKYTITAIAPSGKKITKTIEVVILEEEDEPLIAGPINEEKDEDDNDGDTIVNIKEQELGTDKNKKDTDGDGLADNVEINDTKTDPLKKDTDGDSIGDGYELDLGLDPLKTDSKGDGTKDSERTLTYTINYPEIGVDVEITGKGEISNTTVDALNNSTFDNMNGVLDEVYNFYTTGSISSAKVTIKYDETEVMNQGLTEDTLVLYYFNETTKELEALPTVVDKENNTITVTLTHFSKYIIGDSTKVQVTLDTEILFVLDNSVSMYTEEQMTEAGYSSSTGAVGNDSSFKRISLTNKMIDMFKGNYSYGVSEFAGSYGNLQEFTKDTTKAKDAVSSIESKWTVNLTGTYIIDALKNSIDEFENNTNNHYIMLLTDGKNTNGSWYSNRSDIISKAKEKNIKICVIGLGTDLDTDDLNYIAEQTGCDYYEASDTSSLDQIYSVVGANINYNYVDTDGDSEVDGMIIANSGFITARDGFSFANFSSNKSSDGHCYGMAAFASLYYQNKLPNSLSAAHKWTIFKNFDESNGYNLNYTYFDDGEALYNFKTTTPALTRYLYETPADYRDRVEDNTWMIKKEYKEDLEAIGAKITVKEYKGNDRDFKKYQSAMIQIEDETFEDNVTKDESQVLNAIWRLFIEQVDDKRTGFGASPDKAFKELNDYLNNGVPVILSVADCHAINAVKLIQDIKDSNKFKIEVYDNNYPGEVRYINVERTKFSKFQLNYTAWTNEYDYTFYYDMANDGEAEEVSLGLAHLELD